MTKAQKIEGVLKEHLSSDLIIDKIGDAINIRDKNREPTLEITIYTSSLIGPEFGLSRTTVQSLQTLDLVSNILRDANIIKLGDSTLSFCTWA